MTLNDGSSDGVSNARFYQPERLVKSSVIAIGPRSSPTNTSDCFQKNLHNSATGTSGCFSRLVFCSQLSMQEHPLSRSGFGAIQPIRLAHDFFNPLPPDASRGKVVSEVLFQHHQLIGSSQITAESSMQLNEIFEPALLAQSGVLSNPLQIEKKKRGRLLSPGGQNIRVLQVVMIDLSPVKHLEQLPQADQEIPSLPYSCGSGEASKLIAPIGIDRLAAGDFFGNEKAFCQDAPIAPLNSPKGYSARNVATAQNRRPMECAEGA
jgi:hypothetical protein